MSDTDLVMYRGDDRAYRMTLTDDDGPLDVTGAELTFTAKSKLSLPDDEAEIQLTSGAGDITILDGPGGVIRVAIPKAATADFAREVKLLWDVQIEVGGDTRTIPDADPKRVKLGTLLVRQDVTRTP